MLNWANRNDLCRLHRHRSSTASRRSRIDIVDSAGDRLQHVRPSRANIRSRRHGVAEEPGQGVQPQPRNRLAPQRDRFRPGGATGRGEPTGEQAAPAAVSTVGGEAPPATRSAATCVGLARSASRARRARGRGVQPRGEAQAVGERSEPTAQPPTQVAALCAAGPRGRRSRPLEAVGREGMLNRTGGASSPATPGESATADVPKARPGGWPDRHASARQGNASTSLLS
jgi:hypothetical protein